MKAASESHVDPCKRMDQDGRVVEAGHACYPQLSLAWATDWLDKRRIGVEHEGCCWSGTEVLCYRPMVIDRAESGCDLLATVESHRARIQTHYCALHR